MAETRPEIEEAITHAQRRLELYLRLDEDAEKSKTKIEMLIDAQQLVVSLELANMLTMSYAELGYGSMSQAYQQQVNGFIDEFSLKYKLDDPDREVAHFLLRECLLITKESGYEILGLAVDRLQKVAYTE